MFMRLRVQSVVFTPDEAAVFLGVRRSYLYQLLRDGRLRSFRIGRLRRIHKRDATAFLEELMSAAD